MVEKFIKYVSGENKISFKKIRELRDEIFRYIEKERDEEMHRIGKKIANMIYDYLAKKGFSKLKIVDETDEEFVKFRVEANNIVAYISEENYFWPEIHPKNW